MNWLRDIAPKVFVTCAIGLLAACGSPESKTSTVPEPSTSPTPVPTSAPAGTPTPDSRIPDLTGSVSVNLTNAASLSDLQAIAGQIFPALVGNPSIVMHLTSDRSSFSGDVLFAFEDQKGWWGAQLPIVSEVSIYSVSTNSYYADLFFTDPVPPVGYSSNDLLTFRTVMQSSTADGEALGTIYYRVRTSGEWQCQCLASVSNPACNFAPSTAFSLSACTNYMATSNTQVKSLGQFRVKLLNWIK